MRAEFQATTLNEETRTIEVTWTTGSKGERFAPGIGKYFEELSLERSAVNMDFLTSGRAKFLASHDMRNLDSVLGVIESADIGTAKIRFSRDEISERNLQKIRDGILTDVSVGYRVDQYTDVSLDTDEYPTLRATRWTPIEVSLVPVGFDPGAVVRSETINENDVEIISRSETITEIPAMDEIEKKRLEQEKVTALENAKKEERARVLGIKTAVREAKLDEALADQLIERNASVEEAKSNVAALVKYAQEQEATRVASATRIESGPSQQEKMRTGFEEALMNRIDSKNFQVTEGARQFVGKSALRMIEDFMGRRLGETDSQLAKRAMSSSDLPLILANVAEKSAQKRYELQPRTFAQWTKSDTLRNYKLASQVRAGDFASLLERKEDGEYQEGSFGEEQETAQLKDYGVIHAFTSQMLVNDDLKLIMKVASESGVSAARLENKLAYAALLTNKNMNDGVALYHATHGNLIAATAINEASFAAATLAMRTQKSVNGLDALNITPKFLIVGPAKEVEARKFLSSIVAAQTSNVNIFSNSVELIVDAEITGNQHYFAADPNIIDTVTMFRLEGQESPRVTSRLNWNTDAVELKVAHTAVAEPMDFRGLVKNPGA